MILFDGPSSIIESFYLYSGLTENRFEADQIVNPDRVIYKNKTIWVNSPNYDLGLLAELSKFNTIKSRLKLSNAKFDYQYTPYRIDRINRLKFNILGKSEYEINRNDISNIVIFESAPGNLATILPSYDKSALKIKRHDMSAYELYLMIIENSKRNE